VLCEERHFVWLRKMLSSIRRFAFNLAVGTSVQPNHLPGHTFDHDYFFELPTLRTERQHLLVIGLLSPRARAGATNELLFNAGPSNSLVGTLDRSCSSKRYRWNAIELQAAWVKAACFV